jgi:molybdopterin converting factor small subunit
MPGQEMSGGARTWRRKPMKIHLRLFGELRDYLPEGMTGRQVAIEVPDDLDALALIMRLGIPYNADEGAIVVTINDEQVEHTARINEGDVVSMFEPLAGG